MAINKGESKLTVFTVERTWRTEIESTFGRVPMVTAHREIIKTEGSSNVISRETGVTVRRSFNDVADDSVTVNGKTVTAVDVAAAISAFIDKWREDDIANEQRNRAAQRDEA